MTCAEARPWLQLRQPLPLESGAELTAALAEHVHGCPNCASLVQHCASFDAVVSKAMRDVLIPVSLPHQLRIQTENVHRGLARQRLLRLVTPLALLLLTSWCGWQYSLNAPPDTPVPMYELDAWLRNPIDVSTPITLAYLPRALPTELKDRWNWQYYQRAYLADYQGHRMPVLEFKRGTAEAVIVLLAPEQIEPGMLQQFDGGRLPYASRLLGTSGANDYLAFVVVRTGVYSDFVKPHGTSP